jgi:hypothetical protein
MAARPPTQGHRPPVQQQPRPGQVQTQEPSVDDHPIMRRSRLDQLGTATKAIVAVEILLLFLWMVDSIMRSGATSSPIFLPMQSWVFPLWVICTVMNITLMALHIVRLRWTSDERERLYHVSDYSNGAKAIIVVAIVFIIIFGYPPFMTLVNSELNKPDTKNDVEDFAQEFDAGDAFNVEHETWINISADHPIYVAIHTKADVEAHPDYDGTPLAFQNNTKEWSYDEKLPQGTYYLHLVADNNNKTKVTYTVHRQVDPFLLGMFLWFPIVLMAANIGYGIFLWTEHRRAIRGYVQREQAKIQKAFVIEEVFLIYRDGRLIAHNTRRLKADVDKDILTGMLTAVQNFVRESFQKDEDGILDEMHYGNLRIIIENGPFANMAVVINGPEPKDIRNKMKSILGEIHQTYGAYLAEWDGDTTALAECKKIIGEITPLPPKNIAQDPVQEAFLFHTDNRFIYHVTQRLGPDVDDELLKETAEFIQGTVGKAMNYNPDTVPHSLPYGEGGWHIMLEYGPDAYLAAMLSGPEPKAFRTEMQNLLQEIHIIYGQILYSWGGEMDVLKELKGMLDGLFIRMRLSRRP